MIALAFTLAGLALFTAQILVCEAFRALREIRQQTFRSFGHDTLIYPDHTPT